MDKNHKPDTPPSPRKNGLVKKLSQNGIESLISKESLVLVPDGGDVVMQNGHTNEPGENAAINNNNLKVDQQVINQRNIVLWFMIQNLLSYQFRR